MRLLLGTANPGKAARLKHRLRGLPLEVVTASDHAPGLIVSETGASPEENARLKAAAYYEATKVAALGEDASLEIEGIEAGDQPGARSGASGLSGAR